MSEEFPEMRPQAPQEDKSSEEALEDSKGRSTFTNWMEALARLGIGETFTHVGTAFLTLVGVLIVVWLMQLFYRNVSPDSVALADAPTATPAVVVSQAVQPVSEESQGIPRYAVIHTTIPNRPRQDIIKYTVQQGDTVISIADKYSLKPETILFGNYNLLHDTPENLKVGDVLNILPVDGTYYQWQDGDGLNGVAKFFNVKPDDIVNYPPNKLDAKTVGDYSNPNIKPGTWLIIPGGTRELVSWSAPAGITRSNPAVARVLGPGSCGPVTGGAIGTGSFIWPSKNHYLSGYNYTPIHRGIDIAGNTGEAVWAVDAGVIVYAGWNDWGYGNMIMVDHGNGWQSLYAHLSGIDVVCGQSVDQGTVIGAIGSTGNSSGPHLHFELMHTLYSKVNPWQFLPPP